MRYRLKDSYRVATNTGLFGEVVVTLGPGEVEPKSEQEQAALDVLVEQGHAKPIKGKAKEE